MELQQSTLDKIRSRPRFTIFLQITPEEFEQKLKKYLHEHSSEFSGNVNKEVSTISVKTSEDTYWKPRLSIRSEIEDNQTVVRGIFGPSSAVWTFFMFLYFIFPILWMVFFTIWFVEKQIGSSDFPFSFEASIAALVLLLLTFVASKIGQKKAEDDILKLRKFAEESLVSEE